MKEYRLLSFHSPGSYASCARLAGVGRKRAFTLIELLTVIAIIGILAAILIPVVGKVRDQAKSAACVSNLRQVGLAVHLYAQDHNDRTPPNTGTGGTVGTAMGARLAGLLVEPPIGWGSNYLDTAEVLFCPSVIGHPDFTPEAPGMFTEDGWIGYVWYYLVEANDIELDNTTIESEKSNNMIAMDIGWMPWVNERGWPRAHESKANVLFIGGHVRSVPWSIPDSTANWKLVAKRINRSR